MSTLESSLEMMRKLATKGVLKYEMVVGHLIKNSQVLLRHSTQYGENKYVYNSYCVRSSCFNDFRTFSCSW